MSRVLNTLSAVLCMISPVSGAVTYTNLSNRPVFQGNPVPTIDRLDLNSDGTWDIEFYAFDDTFRTNTNGSTEVIAVSALPPNQGGYIQPLILGELIDLTSPSGGFEWLSGSSAFYSCALFGETLQCIGLWGDGVNYLGFRIEEDDGFHYGFIAVDTPFLGIHGGFIQGSGYESIANTGVVTSTIPETSAWLLVCATSAAYLLKRGRKEEEDNKAEMATPRKPSD